MIKYFTITIFVLLMILASYVLYAHKNEPKTAFIDVYRVYEDFELKKELDSKFTSTQSVRKKMIDSIEVKLNSMAKRLENGEQNNKKLIADFNEMRDDSSWGTSMVMFVSS